ncbi:MAG: hypothetical protein UV57_C0009G0009 [Parcubacteria group bacterium GW2011_GWD2_43_10]|uniref:Hydrogenase maturation protease n=5 Tax=Candidatus Vebleniibacteriota TaxID=1817921 RepID=A0A1G2Q4Q1_9BACT|nr:MAG: hypothetical protein UV47_C0036G0005 [Parcubacteria group bacterium GW2011_GWA2_42_80]KKS78971.1 MAG: hypothetical protein UV52_C0021G0009 [Parcubacteria group bacterium GW2011_GWD1_42_9]KKS83653.1 MAG: hypothetical protein UV57_C0009G0009 [Parcubacteria group bacterium GW2011_GWD2_43_10]KKS93123.1 MAG: hypothetical protein UV69_C0013G0011 [Parcubacteria group bacterium GW2011_GWE2_43_12]KKT12863.1 MAG: hypothetical protein UV92_C0023G0005 [Parcubacteria group bacterium GW2011_GWA1_43_2
MEVWIFGNPDLPQDSLPVRLRPQLASEFPEVNFILQDPLEDWPDKDKLIIIDTVVGLNKVQVFTSLADFANTPLVTMHDFDLKNELAFRAKLGKLPPFVIIGVPENINETEAINQIKPILLQYLT